MQHSIQTGTDEPSSGDGREGLAEFVFGEARPQVSLHHSIDTLGPPLLKRPAPRTAHGPALEVVSGPENLGHRWRLGKRALIGRGEGSEVQIWDMQVSRSHCLIERRPDGLWLRDLESANGTWIEGALVTGSVELREGSRILLGRTTLRVTLVGAPLALNLPRHAEPAPADSSCASCATRTSRVSAERQLVVHWATLGLWLLGMVLLALILR